MDSKPELTPGEVSALDQEEAYMIQFARVFASYHKALVAEGVSEPLADAAVLQWQHLELSRAEDE